VSADFRMSVLTLKDGRVLSGLIRSVTPHGVTLRTVTEEVAVEAGQIAKHEISPASMMPDGLLPALQPDQVRDLIAYLMHPVQVELPR
jgi:putative heme-binding domain-containing protein